MLYFQSLFFIATTLLPVAGQLTLSSGLQSTAVGSSAGLSYVAPAGGCYVTMLLAGGSGSVTVAITSGASGGGAIFSTTFWAPAGLAFVVQTAASAPSTSCIGGAATGVYVQSSNALVAVAGGGGGGSGEGGGNAGPPAASALAG